MVFTILLLVLLTLNILIMGTALVGFYVALKKTQKKTKKGGK